MYMDIFIVITFLCKMWPLTNRSETNPLSLTYDSWRCDISLWPVSGRSRPECPLPTHQVPWSVVWRPPVELQSGSAAMKRAAVTLRLGRIFDSYSKFQMFERFHAIRFDIRKCAAI